MSRASRRRDERAGGAAQGTTRRNRAPLYIMGGSILAAVSILVLIAQAGDGSGHHPGPRADAHEAHVMPAANYASAPRVAETYAKAAQIESVLDGLYCHCYCRETFTHYSLLECFESDHAAGCGVCLDEAEIAYEMTQQGRSLDEIRQVIDARYQSA
jgi:hypothetical protein